MELCTIARANKKAIKITTVANNLIYLIYLKQPCFLKFEAVSRITVYSTAQLVYGFYKSAKARYCSYFSFFQAEELDTSSSVSSKQNFCVKFTQIKIP
jgi:hypothetical protein